jgi:23S rRNA (cytidine1920-2'-O)/16S rRNA (cytidine1409-2'-O)-methyltransferase
MTVIDQRGVERRRLDQLLVERGLADSRSRARSLIEAGQVRLGTAIETKPARLVTGDAELSLDGTDHPWVSRGGIKLAAAFDRFGIDPAGRVGLDIGASTGGFTEVLLARGARQVYAVEVGSGQLAAKLQGDPRITLLEKTNRPMRARSAVRRFASRSTCWCATRASSGWRRSCRRRWRSQRPAPIWWR